MHNNGTLPKEIAFLAEIVGNRQNQYREANWLRSPFNAEIWCGHFGILKDLIIDFHVRLDDGNLLTDTRHRKLLEIFKCWLCIQSHFDTTGGQVIDLNSIKDRVYQTLHLIDFFLLNSDFLGLSKYGLEAVTEIQLNTLLVDLASSSQVANSIYRWPEHLTGFLRGQVEPFAQKTLSSLIAQKPFLAEHLPDSSDRLLNLTDSEIIQSRAWLWNNGYYEQSHGETHRFKPNTAMLACHLYQQTLRGMTTNLSVPEELRLVSMENYRREYPMAPVRGNLEDRLSRQTLSLYKGNLRRLGLLSEINLPVPLLSLRSIDENAAHQVLNLKSSGRFRNLPQEVVFSSLRKAIEFALEYGDDLISSYLSLVLAARSHNLSCRTYLSRYPIAPLLTSKIAAMGVRNWALEEARVRLRNSVVNADQDNYFQRLRANEGLRELIRVLYGAVHICVGTVMARRQSELVDLIAGRCLDNTETRLIFFNRKSGEIGLREKEARPIPKVAVRLIKQLERLQKGLIDQGLLTKPTRLFAYPNSSGAGLIGLSQSSARASLDLFCDYTKTSINRNGQRYYIRQHQLRRFFAMLFFWGSSFGGMETLRWFLGHTDVEHLYHYITESTTGVVLRSVKAHYAVERAKSHAGEAEALADLLEQHFGTRNFSVLEDEELEEYVEDLMDDGQVEIEPEFIQTPEGKSYRILIKTTSKGRQR